MATKEELLKEIEGVGSAERAPQAAADLDNNQRLILQNLFDTGTQLKRREAYLNKLGFEMNPKDPNQYKPKGTPGAYREIDPGIGSYKTWFSAGEFGKIAKELAQDSGDILYDSLVTAPADVSARAGGAVAGTIGGPAGIAAGAILGGAAGNAAAESMKTALGDLFLDKNVPVDKEAMILESAISGMMPEVLQGVAKSAPAVYLKQAARSSVARLNALKKTVNELGTVSKEIVDGVIKKPWNFTEERLSKANEMLTKNFENFFGINENSLVRPKDINGVPNESVIGKVLAPLREAQKAELAALDKNPNAGFKYSDIMDFLSQARNQLEAVPGDQRSSEIDSAIGYLNDRMRKTFAQAQKLDPNIQTPGDLAKSPFPLQKKFSDMKQMLESVQSDIFESEIPGGTVLRQIFGGSDTGLRTIMDQKASSVGSALPQINGRLSQGLSLYNDAADIMKPNRVRNAFSKTQTDEKVLVNRVLDQISKYAKESSTMVDNLSAQRGYKINNSIPTEDFLENFRSDAIAANVQNILETGSTPGSASAIIAGSKKALQKGAERAGQAFAATVPFGGMSAAKITTPVAGALGAMEGFMQGSRAGNPRIAVSNLQDAATTAMQRLGPEAYAEATSAPAEGFLASRLKAPGRLASDVGSSLRESASSMYSEPATNLRDQILSTLATLPVNKAGSDDSRTVLDSVAQKPITKEDLLKELEGL